ncbi:MAG: dephospho-CoA kinase, partial [Myxococcota bacterium]
APGEPALDAIAARWPAVVVDGRLDRKALGAVIVADPEARRALEAITHPRIWARTEEWLAARAAEGVPWAVVEAALMVETGSWRRYDALLVVSCSPDTQRARLATREGYDAATADRWLAAQMPLVEKEKVATAVIRNETDRAALKVETDRVWRAITEA